MIEQLASTVPNEAAPATTTVSKLVKKSKPPKTATTLAAKKRTEKITPQTDDQKRLARNAALREWRKKNADRHRAYMKAWAAKRKVQKPGAATTGEVTSAAARKTAPKKSKKSKKGGKA